jgi:hypothetical protein
MLVEAGPWQAEARPDLALAAPGLSCRDGALDSWVAEPDAGTAPQVVDAVFGGSLGKFQHAARRLCLA